MPKTTNNTYLTDTSSSGKSSKITLIIVGILMLSGAVAVAIAVPLTTVTQASKNRSFDQAIEILNQAPVFDGHNDWPYQMRRNRRNVLNNISLYDDFTQYYTPSHTDIPRIREGRLGAQFWVCYVSCDSQQKDSVRQGVEQMDITIRMIDSAPDDFVLAKTSTDVENAIANGKVASLIGVEGGHMIDSSLGALRMYFQLGARYMSPTHTCSTPWAGASNEPNKGLTDFGKLVIKEMNRLGMLVDLAHVSDQVMHDVLDMVEVPVIFSHSSVRALCDHERNVPDDVLRKVQTNQGIVMVNFYPGFVTCATTATTQDVADHFDYLKNLIGVDHIGIGADYDGIPRLPSGLDDVSKYPNIIAELIERNWSEAELKKITNGNILRVMKQVENFAAAQQQSSRPAEEWIPASDVEGIECRT